VRLVPYDFRRPIQLSKGFVRSLSMVGETYSKLMTLSLSNYLRIPVNVQAHGVRQVIFEEYTHNIPNPSCINIIDIKPIKIPGILDMELGLVFTMIEKLLGCRALTNDTRREFSAIEMRIARKIVQRMLADLREAMLRILEVEVSLQGIEHNPDFTYIMNANDPCILMDFTLELGDFKGDMTVCISLAGLDAELGVEGVSSYRDVRSEDEREADQERLQRILHATRADVVAELGRVSLSLSELKALREGSVISLRKQVQEPIVVRVGRSPVFHARMGRFNKKNAVRITQVLVSELASLRPGMER
jgi:flagellar motor switch protein FliM